MSDIRPTTVCAAVALSLTCSANSRATSYSLPEDFKVLSPNGAYLFVADHPDWSEYKEGEPLVTVYKLIDTQSDKVLWTLDSGARQPPSEEWPGNAYGAYVSNRGDVLLRGTSSLTLTPLASEDGSVGPRMSVVFDLTEHQHVSGQRVLRQAYMQHHLFKSLIEIEDEWFVLMRARWGARKLIGFERHEVIDELTEAQAAVCAAVEQRWATETLEDATDRLDEHLDAYLNAVIEARRPQIHESSVRLGRLEYDLQTAIQIVERSAHAEAMDSLRAIESWRAPTPTDSSITEVRIRFMASINYELWRSARRAIRRLGEQPSGRQPTWCAYRAFVQYEKGSIWLPLKHHPLPAFINDIAASAELVRPDMSLPDALDVLGAPDARRRVAGDRHLRHLEFDIDAEEPFTLRVDVYLSADERAAPRVVRVERISPPRWTIEAGRDLEPEWSR